MMAENIQKVLIIGTGTMGQQIALHFAINGCNVVLFDIEKEILDRAFSNIRRIAESLIHQQRIHHEEADSAICRISATTIVENAAVDVDLISESVPEDPELKKKVFAIFHRFCPPKTLFTTNTSTLLPSMLAPATGRPEKFLAFHFHDLRMNRVVDIMPHPGTDKSALQIVHDFAKRMGLIPILLKKENSGYVFNAMFGVLLQSAQTLAANQVASVEDIDRAWMGVTRMPIGPFGLMDSVGIDTVWRITDYWAKIRRDVQGEKNAEFLKQYVDRGDIGQKSGKGFYSYPKPLFTKVGFVEGWEDHFRHLSSVEKHR